MNKKNDSVTGSEMVAMTIDGNPFSSWGEIEIQIRGTTPLIQAAMGPLALKAIAGSTVENPTKTSARGKIRDPKAEAEDAVHYGIPIDAKTKKDRVPRHGIPAAAFKRAICAMAATFKVKRYGELKICLRVLGDLVNEQTGMNLVVVEHAGDYLVRATPVPIKGGGKSMSYRPEFPAGWRATVRISYAARIFSAKTIAELMVKAGAHNGVGERRPNGKTDSGLDFGLWEVESAVAREPKFGKDS